MPSPSRAFAVTFRTRNRKIREQITNAESLANRGLPLWESEEDLAQALDISVKELRLFSIHRHAARVAHYIAFAVAKRSGGRRVILAPKRKLKTIQRKLHQALVSKLPVSDYAHGFRKGRCVRTAAETHVGKEIVLRMDLQDFFPTVTFARVRGLLVRLGYNFPIATILAVLMTEAERQPVKVDEQMFHVPVGRRYCVQGAPTSPGLCNCIASRLDHRLAGLAKKFGFSYTRYADDLTFSGPKENVHRLAGFAGRIIRAEGFRINPAKTHFARKGRRQTVTGVVVNDSLGLSRRQRRRIRAMIHQYQQKHSYTEQGPRLLNRLRGKLAYLAMLNPAQAEALRRRWQN